MKAQILGRFPKFGKTLLAEIEANSRVLELKPGDCISEEDLKDVQAVVLEGSVKMLEKIRGQFFLLYRVKNSQSLSLPPEKQLNKEFKRCAETNAIVLLIPNSSSKSWVCTYPSWRKFLDELYSNTLEKLLDTLWYSGDCLENRIMAYLGDLSRTQDSTELQITHSEIAEEIGSVREVVSRSLKKLENHGQLILKRGRILLKASDYQSLV